MTMAGVEDVLDVSGWVEVVVGTVVLEDEEEGAVEVVEVVGAAVDEVVVVEGEGEGDEEGGGEGEVVGAAVVGAGVVGAAVVGAAVDVVGATVCVGLTLVTSSATDVLGAAIVAVLGEGGSGRRIGPVLGSSSSVPRIPSSSPCRLA